MMVKNQTKNGEYHENSNIPELVGAHFDNEHLFPIK